MKGCVCGDGNIRMWDGILGMGCIGRVRCVGRVTHWRRVWKGDYTSVRMVHERDTSGRLGTSGRFDGASGRLMVRPEG
jgi:hypothetical protein